MTTSEVTACCLAVSGYQMQGIVVIGVGGTRVALDSVTGTEVWRKKT